MTTIYGICDPQREKICTDKLQIFLNDFHRHSKLFKGNVEEAKRLTSRFETLSKKLIILEK